MNVDIYLYCSSPENIIDTWWYLQNSTLWGQIHLQKSSQKQMDFVGEPFLGLNINKNLWWILSWLQRFCRFVGRFVGATAEQPVYLEQLRLAENNGGPQGEKEKWRVDINYK